jgi:FlaA1/EpsC-like NDP-sugar epimerase
MVFTGPRAGEKLFEELSIEGEDMKRTRHPKISIWKNIPIDRDRLRASIDELTNIANTQDRNEIVQKIKELVPEYTGLDMLLNQTIKN